MIYSDSEERLNVATHAIGVLLSLPAAYFLISKSDNMTSLAAAIIFSASLFLLYLASTVYHASANPAKRKQLRILDHSAIFVLIAGTYTPICMISLWDNWGKPLLVIIWSIAIAGIVLKLFFTGRFDRASTVLYVVMGWIALVAIKPLLESVATTPLLWLLAGGIFYTVGAVLYSFRKLPYNHAIFHVFVLGGSTCHYIMIYNFVI